VKMRTTMPTPRDDLAIMVWEKLAKQGDVGLAIWECQKFHLPELSKGQIQTGLTRISHVLQESREKPLVNYYERGRGTVWRFASDPLDYRTYALRRTAELITRARTQLAGAEAAVSKWPDDLAPYVPKMLTRAVEDLEDLLVELGYGMGDR
jgi:hypothetical protein